jgi:hypothetical protein
MTHTSPRAPQSSPAPTDGAWQPVPLLGLLCAASGALGVVVSVVTLAYRADVEDRTPVGQVLLVLLLSAYVATLIWMRRMAAGKPLPRFLATRAVAEVTR